MRPGAIWNWVGSAVIMGALLLHVISLATPHYAQADFSKLHKVAGGPSAMNTTVNYGFWEFCQTIPDLKDDHCIFWTFDTPKLVPGTWLKASRNLACVGAGVLLKCAIGIFLNLVVVSRGDRHRYLPFIICGFCCAGGLFLFVGDMVFAANYKSKSMDYSPESQNSNIVIKVMSEQFKLSWGFALDLVAAFLACLAGGFHVLARYSMDKAGGCDSHGVRLI